MTRLSAKITCPAGHDFTAEWAGAEIADQTCPVCSVTFTATWPGFEFAPEVVIVEPDGGSHETAP